MHRFAASKVVHEFTLPAYRLVVNGGDYRDFPQLHFHLISDTLGLNTEN